MSDLLKDGDFLRLEKVFPLLARYRSIHELDKLPYVIVDIETTGLDPSKSEIIEIGAIKTSGLEGKDIFTTLIEPVSPIPAEIEKLTGISQNMVKGQPNAKDALERFINFIEGHVLIAHHTDFDINFLNFHINKELQKQISNKILCTVKVSRGVIPGLPNYKLHTVAQNLQIAIPNRHRAMGDCEITFNIWNKLVDIMKSKGITTFDEAEKFMSA